MGKIEELEDKAEKLRIWLSFWLNLTLAILVGLATVVFSYSTNNLSFKGTIVLLFVLLTFLTFVAKMVTIVWKKQEDITEEIAKEKH